MFSLYGKYWISEFAYQLNYTSFSAFYIAKNSAGKGLTIVSLCAYIVHPAVWYQSNRSDV